MKFGNLHLHSSYSDCGFRPTFIACAAKSLGYQAIALTDHETIEGLPELFAACKNNGIEAMSGIELYAPCNGHSPHITGLDFDPEHPAIVKLSEQHVAWRNECTRAKFEDAIERGVVKGVTWDDIVHYNPISKWYGPDQIAWALDAMKIHPMTDFDSIWYPMFKEGKSPTIKMQKATVEEIFDAIHAAGGIAVLAHATDKYFDDGTVDELIAKGLDGIEVSHPDMTERAMKLAYHRAMEHNLYCSGGTDHTGPLSACGGQYAIPAYQGVTEDEYKAIKERRFG